MSAHADIAAVLAGERRWCVIEGDCRDFLPGLPAGSIDHFITDPPYDEKTHVGARTGAGAAEGVSFAALPSEADVVVAALRITKRWILCFGACEQLGAYRDAAGEAWVRAGIWDRVNPSPQLTGDRPGQAVEGIAIMHRAGRKRWNRGGGAAIWRYQVDRGYERPDHPTPKPLRLMLALLGDFTDPSDVLADPFAGSGTTGVAALRLGRRVILIERDHVHAQTCRERMAAEEQGMSLSAVRNGQEALFR